MCYISIYSVTRSKTLALISCPCYERKAETFLSVNVKRSKIQTMARKHTHLDQVQKVVGLITNKPSAIFLLQQNCAEGALRKVSIKNLFQQQGRF